MTTCPNSPKIQKPGLVVIDPEAARVLRIIPLPVGVGLRYLRGQGRLAPSGTTYQGREEIES